MAVSDGLYMMTKHPVSSDIIHSHNRVMVAPFAPSWVDLTAMFFVEARKIKVRKEEQPRVPRSLFNRPMSALRRDASKLVKLKHHALLKPFKPQPLSAVNRPLMDTSHDQPEWLIHEDWALLQVRRCCGLDSHRIHCFLLFDHASGRGTNSVIVKSWFLFIWIKQSRSGRQSKG